MATTSLSFGEHWEVFIRNEISSGRYGSTSEVVRDALRAHLVQGAEQAKANQFVDHFSMNALINELDSEG